MTDHRSAYVRSHGYRNYMDFLFISPHGSRIVTVEQAIEEIEASQSKAEQGQEGKT